jgi:hypothetical protein
MHAMTQQGIKMSGAVTVKVLPSPVFVHVILPRWMATPATFARQNEHANYSARNLTYRSIGFR